MSLLLAQAGTPVLTQIFADVGGASAPVLYCANAGKEPTSDPALDNTAELYSGRGLAMLRHGDVATLAASHVGPQRELVQHLSDVGVSRFRGDHIIGIPELERVSPRLSDDFVEELRRPDSALHDDLRRFGSRILLPYIFEPNTDVLAKMLGLRVDASARQSDRINNKLTTKRALARLGVPVPTWRAFYTEGGARRAFNELFEMARRDPRASGSIFAKLNRSAAGRGVKELRTRADFDRWVSDPRIQAAMRDRTLTGGAFMDIGVRPRAENPSPNFMIHVGPNGLSIYINGSYQMLLDGTAHVGNWGPVSQEDLNKVWPYLTIIAKWMQSMGICGLAGIDFVMGEDGVAYLMEINFRMNGSTTAAMLATFYGASAWIYGKIAVEDGTTVAQAANHLSQSHILFDGTSGAVILNALPALHGHGLMQGAFFAGNTSQARGIWENAQMTSPGH